MGKFNDDSVTLEVEFISKNFCITRATITRGTLLDALMCAVDNMYIPISSVEIAKESENTEDVIKYIKSHNVHRGDHIHYIKNIKDDKMLFETEDWLNVKKETW